MGAIVTFDPETVRGREVHLVQGMSGIPGLTQQGWDLVGVVCTDQGEATYVLSRPRRTTKIETAANRIRLAQAYAAGASAREAWAKEHGKEKTPFDRVAMGEDYAKRVEREE
jgi:hypothetical protein